MDLDKVIELYTEAPDTIIDLTEPKTFIVACVVAILLGVCIGTGYYVVFTSVDCTSDTFEKHICLENPYADHKLQVVIITVITGIIAGASPYIIKRFDLLKKDEGYDDDDDASEE